MKKIDTAAKFADIRRAIGDMDIPKADMNVQNSTCFREGEGVWIDAGHGWSVTRGTRICPLILDAYGGRIGFFEEKGKCVVRIAQPSKKRIAITKKIIEIAEGVLIPEKAPDDPPGWDEKSFLHNCFYLRNLDEADVIKGIQHLINTGRVWKIDDYVARKALHLIKMKVCFLKDFLK